MNSTDALYDERSLLAIALTDPQKLANVTLPKAAFTDPTNRAIYHSLTELYFSGEAITPSAVVAACDSVDESYLRRLLSEADPLGIIGYYAERIAKRHEHEQGLYYLREMVEDVSSGSPLYDNLLRLLERVESQGSDDGKPLLAQQLIHDHPSLHPPIIHGLLRRGETANIIAAPKTGKSWLVYDLCIAIATGGRFLGRFKCEQGRVLLLDYELHASTLAGRIRTAADALGVRIDELGDRFQIRSLRGRLTDINAIAQSLSRVPPGTLDLIGLDAFYRALPNGTKENDNGEITGIYNLIDRETKRLGCAWVNIHHSSKGSQADKSVTDVGAGAGAQSRAADTHIVLRPHQEPGVIVLDAAVRSFPPIEPLSLRWTFPCFTPVDDVDPAALLGKMSTQERRQVERDGKAISEVLNALQEGTATARQLRAKTGLSRERLQRLLDKLEADDQITGQSVVVRGNDCREYRLPDDVGDDHRPRNRPGAHVGVRGGCGSYKEEPPTHPRHPEGIDHVEGRTSRPRGTADDPIVFEGHE